LLGFICIKDDRFENAYNSEELSYMMMVAAQLAIIVENSRLFEAVKERERLAVLGAMAAGLAHEIRNPLGAIKGAAQLLNPDAHDENEREFIGIILEEVDRLNGVVSQFLDYARPMRNGLMLIDINQVLRRTVQLLDAEKLMSQVVIHENLQPDLPLIYADAEQLKQVFINLLHNSAEAMSEGGSIFVQSELIGDIDNPMVEISFADEGAGIPPEVLKNIFIPFFTTKERGTGMGLSICQRIIEHHDGSIQVQNRPTKGTVIIIRLPVQRPPNNKNMR
jgi:signal transduction histidine kinase